MSRFYERYGLFIVWLFTVFVGLGLLYWGVVALAKWETLPADIGVNVLGNL